MGHDGLEPPKLFAERLQRSPFAARDNTPCGAGGRIRTDDRKLGKLQLYQLSYTRMIHISKYTPYFQDVSAGEQGLEPQFADSKSAVLTIERFPSGVLERARTSDPLLRRQLLYPTELQGHGAGGWIRTNTVEDLNLLPPAVGLRRHRGTTRT